MVHLIRKNISFFLPYLLILIGLLYFIFSYEKIEIHIFFNSYHNRFFDLFFKLITQLGDGYFAVIITVFLLFIKFKWAIISAVSNLITSLFVQISKLLIFTDYMRPKFYFDYLYKGDHVLHLVDGASPGIHYSFPSGHSATAFAIFLLLALIQEKHYLKVIFLLVAILTAYSRIYLSWHFLQDTVVGSLYGIFLTLLSFYFISKSNRPKLDKKIRIFKK